MHPGRNIIHGADCEAAAEREIPLWFTKEELIDWEPIQTTWVYEPQLEGRPTSWKEDL